MCNPPKPADSSKILYGLPDEYAPEFKADECTPLIGLADTARVEEALVHELLHLEIMRLGYPRFWFSNAPSVAASIQNDVDHVVMLPKFVALGYSADRFLTPRELTDLNKNYLQEIEALPNMHTPDGYTVSVSAYLTQKGYRFRLAYVRA